MSRFKIDGETLRALRKSVGLSQEVLAEASGVSQPLISKYENNAENRGGSLNDVVLLSRALGVNMEDLVTSSSELQAAREREAEFRGSLTRTRAEVSSCLEIEKKDLTVA